MLGTLATVLIVLVVVGFIGWLINEFVPMEPRFKRLLLGVLAVIVIIWLLMYLLGGRFPGR